MSYQAKRSQPTKRKEPLVAFSGELPRAMLDELANLKELSGALKTEILQEALRDYFQKKKSARRCVQCPSFKKKGAYLCAKCNQLLQNRVARETVPLLGKEL